MSSKIETAEQRFRLAFERLKVNRPNVLPRGTQVSQNNVAKEAGTDPTALRKTRYPALIREIQAWVEINNQGQVLQQKRRARQKRDHANLSTTIIQLKQQRDEAQSQLISAQRMLLELLHDRDRLQARLDELVPPPRPLKK
jgi:rRNA maturation endonuclease Nob1